MDCMLSFTISKKGQMLSATRSSPASSWHLNSLKAGHSARNEEVPVQPRPVVPFSTSYAALMSLNLAGSPPCRQNVALSKCVWQKEVLRRHLP